VYVRSVGGRRYPITAFNFKMTRSQLVASDRDTLLALGELESYEDKERLLWTRRPFLDSEYRWGKMVVHGHSRCDDVEFRDNRINIDTGCVYRNKLSALMLPGHQVVSVPRQTQARKVVLRDQNSRRGAVRFQGRVGVRVHADGVSLECETLDYSELGMYVRDLEPDAKAKVAVGESVFGVICPGDLGEVTFSGSIVRVAPEASGVHYAVQIHSALRGSFQGEE
ncbi:MAG: PilZ domain-containing protein, partial [Deltaproteobacteria bacterium]|nr:PilZ domain-containing protein [Deltaproteobacteria bacterium]